MIYDSARSANLLLVVRGRVLVGEGTERLFTFGHEKQQTLTQEL